MVSQGERRKLVVLVTAGLSLILIGAGVSLIRASSPSPSSSSSSSPGPGSGGRTTETPTPTNTPTSSSSTPETPTPTNTPTSSSSTPETPTPTKTPTPTPTPGPAPTPTPTPTCPPPSGCGCSWASAATCGPASDDGSVCWLECCCALNGGSVSTRSPTPAPAPTEVGAWEGAGKTTRYWDCCKLSCGWSGKAELAAGFAPVRNCGADGAVADVNAVSICGGGGAVAGPSYSCADGQPWEGEDGVLYGFAASNAPCCACYELEFLAYSVDSSGARCDGCSSYTGQIKGRRMIVQITNSGGDLGKKHFDLQIPGGGFGLFNGCAANAAAGEPINGAPQFADTPYEAWGARYGGIGDLSSCAALPTPLRPGCEWRFGPFKNSDNPGVRYRRTRCPDNVVAVSGCRRADDP